MATRKFTRIIAVVGVAILALAACGNDDSTSSDSAATTTAGEASEGPSISDAWARSTPDDAARTAAYLTVESDEADEIVGVSVPSDVAAMAELHETVTGAMEDGEGMDDEGMGNGHADGAMAMQQVDAIPVSAGTTSLEPGGYHVMLMDLAKPLTDGERFELTLDFERTGPQTVTVTVRTA
ncbi:MAG: copper chaperone PCu(A)C [Acidimicrobiia bacterium]